MRLGILASHPIQYQAPWFRSLAQVVDLEVFFAHRQSAGEQGKAGFGVAFDWDVDLLSGYKYQFLKNASTRPDVNHFDGCDTPEIERFIAGNPKHKRGDPPAFDAFIVNGWYLKCYLQAAAACRRAGVPVLVRGDSHLGTPRPWIKRLAMEIRQRLLLRRFDGFLAVGRRNREYLEHFGVKPNRIYFAPHFVDNDWFAARAVEAKSQRTSIRTEWGATETTTVILFVGKFQPLKRPMDLMQAMVRNKSGNSVLVFVGAGELEKELRAVAAREALPVHFVGFKNQSEVPRYYAAADVLVLPSDSETWGMVVNEAMACGLPVIASDAVGSAPDMIDEGKTGFAFPVGNVDGLAERLNRFESMRKNGHDFTVALRQKMAAYSVQAAVEGTVKAVTELNPRH